MIDAIPSGARIALDTTTLIYFLEGNPRFGPPAGRLFERIEAGDLPAVMSALVLSELLVPLFRRDHRREASLLRHRLEHFTHLDIMPVGNAIAADAARIRAEYGLRTPDAIHAASALAASADGFVTHDKDFRVLRPALEVWTFES